MSIPYQNHLSTNVNREGANFSQEPRHFND
jgi:hypothetical protein